jgi:hypothetical protein
MTDADQRIAALEAWARDEQEQLWDDLDKALNRAINGVWSIECGTYAYRIVQSARLVGATNRDSVQWPLTAGDVYAAVLTAGGIDVPEVTEAQWRADEEHMSKYGLRADLLGRFAATRAAILEPSEAAGIRGDA